MAEGQEDTVQTIRWEDDERFVYTIKKPDELGQVIATHLTASMAIYACEHGIWVAYFK